MNLLLILGKISANRKALRKHQTIHLESWKDRFKCIICGRGFRDSTKLKVSSISNQYNSNHWFNLIFCLSLNDTIIRSIHTFIAVSPMRMYVNFVTNPFDSDRLCQRTGCGFILWRWLKPSKDWTNWNTLHHSINQRVVFSNSEALKIQNLLIKEQNSTILYHFGKLWTSQILGRYLKPFGMIKILPLLKSPINFVKKFSPPNKIPQIGSNDGESRFAHTKLQKNKKQSHQNGLRTCVV